MITGHSRKIYSIKFHPTVTNLLASIAADGSSKLWDLNHLASTTRSSTTTSTTTSPTALSPITGEVHSMNKIYDTQYHDLCWNHDGSRYIISSKENNGSIYFIDPRTSKISSTINNTHNSNKTIKLCSLYTDYSHILSVGCDSTGGAKRQVKVWDPRQTKEEVYKVELDSAPGALMPFYDSDLRYVWRIVYTTYCV